jgi:hypothetical protein
VSAESIRLLCQGLALLVLAANFAIAVAALVVAVRLDLNPLHRAPAWRLFRAAAAAFAMSLLSRLHTLAYGPLVAALGGPATFAVAALLDLLGAAAFALVGVALLRFAPAPVQPAERGGVR